MWPAREKPGGPDVLAVGQMFKGPILLSRFEIDMVYDTSATSSDLRPSENNDPKNMERPPTNAGGRFLRRGLLG